MEEGVGRSTGVVVVRRKKVYRFGSLSFFLNVLFPPLSFSCIYDNLFFFSHMCHNLLPPSPTQGYHIYHIIPYTHISSNTTPLYSLLFPSYFIPISLLFAAIFFFVLNQFRYTRLDIHGIISIFVVYRSTKKSLPQLSQSKKYMVHKYKSFFLYKIPYIYICIYIKV